MFNKAVKYLNNGRTEKALAIFKKLPPYKEVLCNMGTCYRQLGNDDKARELYLKALDPKIPLTDHTFTDIFPIALNNLALLAYTYEQDDVAIELLYEALKKDPLYYDAMWNLSNALLRKYCSNKYDDLSVCWDLYHYRYMRTNPVVLKSKKQDLIQWEGNPVEHLCVMVEQGFGDQLMFGRYLSLAAQRCGKITVQTHKRAKIFFDAYDTCEDPSETTATHGIGICGLAKIFNTEIPRGDWLNGKYVPKAKNGVLDIGCTWSGNSNHVNDKYRSASPSLFRSLADCGNLYTLNPTEANTPGFTTLKSGHWGETIEELSRLDVVVSVDTSIVHLCGSLGMPCYVVLATKNNDFRWGDSSMGMNNIWYPSVKVIRNDGSWEKAIESVRNELKNFGK